MNNFAVRKPTPNGAERLRTVQMRYAQLRTVKKNGTYRDASLKSLSVTARRDACHASGTKATVTLTHYLKTKKKMKERIKNPWLRWTFPKPKNLEQWWWLFTIGAISVTFLYIVFFSIITQP